MKSFETKETEAWLNALQAGLRLVDEALNNAEASLEKARREAKEKETQREKGNEYNE